MIDFIADYLQNIRSRRVFPDVSPGYMSTLVPDSAPSDPEPWQNIFDDIETVIMPGVRLYNDHIIQRLYEKITRLHALYVLCKSNVYLFTYLLTLSVFNRALTCAIKITEAVKVLQ